MTCIAVVPGRTPQSSPTKPAQASWSPGAPTAPGSPSPAAAAVTNETLAWELLYNRDCQLSTREAETSWRDATGETNVMLEPVPQLQAASPDEAKAATQIRVRRIAEATFWDSLSGLDAWDSDRLQKLCLLQLKSVLHGGSLLPTDSMLSSTIDRIILA